MKALALDISTKAGWAVLTQNEDGSLVLGDRGLLEKEKSAVEYGQYPRSYRQAATFMAEKLQALVIEHKPDIVVVEETNQLSKGSRYTQKLLEWIHRDFQRLWDTDPTLPEPIYISTGIWKSTLGLKKPKDAKKNDELLKKAKLMANTGQCTLAEAKKKVGVRGKWNKKMLAVEHVNESFGLDFILKDNDTAEAICLGEAYFKGAAICDGDPSGKGKE